MNRLSVPGPALVSASLVSLALASSACAQAARSVSADATVRSALERVRADNAWTLEQQTSICEIPAPPFKEAARAEELRKRFETLGLRNVRIDEEGNVIGERPGTGSGPSVMISAHLDTVFPEGTDVTVRLENGVHRGPGIGDDCRGLAVLLAVARAMEAAKVRLPGTVLFVGTVGEEGEGNLRGVRHLFRAGAPRPAFFISVDGTGLDVTTRAVGSKRYRVTYQGPGGHSYGAFGMPNPIHALGRAIAEIGDIQVPASPRTTFNVGVISGGTSVNSISATGVMDVDLRSESPAALDSLEARFRAAVARAVDAENGRWPASRVRITVQVDDLGFRPAGGQGDDAPIVRTALETGRALGFTPETGASSTDANIPMSLGVPAITIDGGGRGRGSHSLSESYEDGDRGWLGPQWALLLTARLAGGR